MTTSTRTTHQRDRRFARVHLVTRSIFVGSSVLSVGMVGYLANITKLHTTVHPAATSTSLPATTTTLAAPTTGGASSTPVTTPPVTTTVPVTTTTTCYTTPSGNTTCN